MPADPNRLEDVFLAASEIPAAERAAYLDRACGADVELRASVDRLLAAHADPASMTIPCLGPEVWRRLATSATGLCHLDVSFSTARSI